MRVKVGNQTSEDREQIELDTDGTITVTLNDNQAGNVVLSLATGDLVLAAGTSQRKNSVLVTQAGHPSADIPAGAVSLKFDAYNNFILGNNKLLTTTTGNLPANGILPTGLMYQQESHGLFVQGLRLYGVGDPCDLVLGRAGPNNSWPDNAGLGIAGVPAGTTLGVCRFRGAATPNGGTPDVTLGAVFQGDSAIIYAKSSEDNVYTGSAYHQGGELHFATTPNGSSTTTDRLVIGNDGKVQFTAGPGTAVLATGAAHTVDDVVAALQTLGLVKQS